MNVLITSASAKVSLITAFQNACNARGMKLVTVDCDPNCKAVEVAGHFYVVPRDDDPAYGEALFNICEAHNIKLIIPTRDSELIKLAKMKQLFTDRGIHIPLSTMENLEVVLNKMVFHEFCTQNGFSVLPIIEPNMHAPWPLFVRSTHGAGGSRAMAIATWQDWQRCSFSLSEVICQPICSDDEYSIDVLMDLSGKPLQAVARKRMKVDNGECVEGIIVDNTALEEKSLELCTALGLRGHNIVQAFCTDDGDMHFIEVNARFGGASMMSAKAGLNSPERLISMGMGMEDSPEKNQAIKYGVTYRRNAQRPECYDEIVPC